MQINLKTVPDKNVGRADPARRGRRVRKFRRAGSARPTV